MSSNLLIKIAIKKFQIFNFIQTNNISQITTIKN